MLFCTPAVPREKLLVAVHARCHFNYFLMATFVFPSTSNLYTYASILTQDFQQRSFCHLYWSFAWTQGHSSGVSPQKWCSKCFKKSPPGSFNQLPHLPWLCTTTVLQLWQYMQDQLRANTFSETCLPLAHIPHANSFAKQTWSDRQNL